MTPFGEYCRYKRIQNCVSLKAQAAALSVSPSYLSSLELGKKNKPSKNLIHKIGNFYSLNLNELHELEQAARDSLTTVKIPENSKIQVYRLINRITKNPEIFSRSELDLIEVMINNKKPLKENIIST